MPDPELISAVVTIAFTVPALIALLAVLAGLVQRR